jgi:DNA-binding LacI/PurR family transcriptional regulator
MAVSIRHVAERAGVSLGTVSKVLNNSEHAQIAQVTRQRVRSAAQELGYRPNPLARSLGRQRTDTIGLMLSDLRNPFFLEVLELSERMVHDAGYQVLLDVNPAKYSAYHELGKISGWLVDGVLMWATPDVSLSQHLGDRAQDIPVVYLGHLREDGSDAVAMDLYGAGVQAARHLLERGYKKPCFMSTFPAEDFLHPGHDRPGWRNNQMPAYLDVCREAGIKPEVINVGVHRTPYASFQAGLEIGRRPAASRPDAIICRNDWMALYVCNAIVQCGLRIPDDIALIGFDGLEEGACIPNGPLTTVKMPIDALCSASLEILLKRMDGADTSMPPQQVLIPMELVPGRTT